LLVDHNYSRTTSFEILYEIVPSTPIFRFRRSWRSL